jgi:hypothetical protein
MEVVEIKTELHQTIEHVDGEQLKQIYGLITNYLNGDDEWYGSTDAQKNSILKGLEQADAGEGNSLKDVNNRLKAKYGINA